MASISSIALSIKPKQDHVHPEAVSNDEVETNDGDAEHELIAKDKLRNRSGVLSAMKGFAGRMRKLDVERESTFSWSQAATPSSASQHRNSPSASQHR